MYCFFLGRVNLHNTTNVKNMHLHRDSQNTAACTDNFEYMNEIYKFKYIRYINHIS